MTRKNAKSDIVFGMVKWRSFPPLVITHVRLSYKMESLRLVSHATVVWRMSVVPSTIRHRASNTKGDFGMPDYLEIDRKLSELDTEAAELLLMDQREKVQAAISRLEVTDRAPADILDLVVSV